jgi:S1/P1 Nuclease
VRRKGAIVPQLCARLRAPACRSYSFASLARFQKAALFGLVWILAALFTPAPAGAWGCKGHQVVALIAEKHITPHALAMMKQILADSPIDPNLNRYCKEGGADPMADASTWPDDIRSQRPETPPWHYVDIPLGVTQREVEKFCDPKPGCVTSAIRDELATLGSKDADAQTKADALRLLIHFVGDIHQPLHGVNNNDLGGNCVPVTFFDERPQLRNQQLEIYSPNLHAAWDTNILERATIGQTSEQVASELDKSFQKEIATWQKVPANIDTWAWESHLLAQNDAYGKLPVHIPPEAPHAVSSCADDNNVAARMLALNEQITAPYQAAATPIVLARLAQAGARLALLLNQIWP